jgi:hypothetical protein
MVKAASPGACVTSNWRDTPPPASEICPERSWTVVFAATVYSTVPLPLPSDPLVIEIQPCGDDADQDVLDETDMLPGSTSAPCARAVGATLRTASAPLWLNATSRVRPPAMTVITPLRDAVAEFAVTAYSMLPSPSPELPLVIDIHPWSALAVQVVFDVTVTLPESACAPCVRLVGVTVSARDSPLWVSATSRVRPPPMTVITPLRDAVAGFAVTAYSILPSPSPELPLVIDIHPWSALAVQVVFDVTVTLPESACAPWVRLVGVTASARDSPLWLTETSRVSPPPETVISPLREAVVGFVVTAYSIVPSPSPELPLVIDIHPWSALAVQVVFDVTVTLPESACAPCVRLVGVTVSVKDSPLWLTETSRVRPPPMTVINPLRDAVVGFAVTAYSMLPSPSPELPLVIDIHPWSALAVQVVFDVTATLPESACAPCDTLSGDVVR